EAACRALRHRRAGVARGMDDAAAQADVTVIQHGRLAWRHSPLQILEAKLEFVTLRAREHAGRIRLPIARLRAERTCWWRLACHPARVRSHEARCQQPGMVMALADIQR